MKKTPLKENNCFALTSNDLLCRPLPANPFYTDNFVVIYNADCRELLPHLSSVSHIITDPPYGVTACAWDSVPDLPELWQMLKPLCSGAFVFTATQPFATDLINSNRKDFRFEDIWAKPPTGMMMKDRALRSHENILIFGRHKFNPQPFDATVLHRKIGGVKKLNSVAGHEAYGQKEWKRDQWIETGERFPRSVFYFGRRKNNQFTKNNQHHPTEKPLELMEYLIATYTDKGDTILDPFAGSGTTLIAARNLGRKAIGIEISKGYCETAVNRLAQSPLIF